MPDMFPTAMPVRPLSVMEARDPEVLSLMLKFYSFEQARVLDVTANTRKMWKGADWSGTVTFCDVDDSVGADFVADFRSLPFADGSFDVIVFDPPHLPLAAASPQSMTQMVEDYGLSKSVHADNISEFFSPFLKEALRVLSADGLIFAKLKDFVHNHKYQWSLVDFVSAVRLQAGLTPCDLIVKKDPCGGNLKSSKWVNAHHVRNSHCWWVVVRKGKCEAKKADR
jgi:hypothetical protein